MRSLLRCLLLLALFCLPVYAESNSADPSTLRSTEQEIQYLQNLVLQAKQSGSTIDPAWMARLQELWALQPKPQLPIPYETNNIVDASVPLAPASLTASQEEVERLRAQVAEMKARGEVIDPALVERLNRMAPAPMIVEPDVPFNAPIYEGAEAMRRFNDPLETQIRELENEIYPFTSAIEPPPPTLEQIEQLNALYAQRPENQIPYDRALDQGADACAGTVIPGVPYTDSGTTVGFARNFNPACDNGASTAPDVIYAFTPALTNLYTVTITTNYNSVLSIRTTGACPGTTELGCSNGGAVSSMTLTLNASTNYWFIVGGQLASSGTYTLTVTDSCSNPCLGTDIVECAESVGDTAHGRLDCDGGCNNLVRGGVATYSMIQFGQTICGRGFTYTSATGAFARDTDWYQFIVTEPCTVKANLEAEFLAQVFFLTDACPATVLLNTSNSQCRPMELSLYFSVPDTYIVFVSTVSFIGIPIARPYRLSLTCCPVAATLNAPAQVTGNTCGAGNECSLKPSEDLTYRVNIPYQGFWRFYTCSALPIWDSYLYLTTQCCGGTILASDDDGCGGVGFSLINCVFLQPGTYYLTVEGFIATNCGQFTLTVSECYGRCCYGGPSNPQCSLTDTTGCQALAGLWSLNTTCESNPCDTTHFLCQDGAEFGQIPYLAGEPGVNAYFSSTQSGLRTYEHYSISQPINHIRFWGSAQSSFPSLPCVQNPLTCTISFHQDSSIWPNANAVSTYSLIVPGVFTQNINFGNNYPFYQYEAEIWPACSLLTGWVSIIDIGMDGCQWAWEASPHGNDTIAYRSTSGLSFVLFNDLAVCLGGDPHCGLTFENIPPQAVTISVIGNPSNPSIRLNWMPSDTATYEIWSTTTPNNDGNPDNGNDPQWVCEARIPVNDYGNPQTWVDPNPTVLYKNYVIIQGCRPPNDACDHPIFIGKGITPIDNRGASTDGPTGVFPCRAYLDLWYVYTAPATEPDTLSFCADVGGFATWDTEVVVYAYTGSDDCPSAGGELACNDDFCGVQSRVQWNSVAGTQYLIRIGAFFSSTGTGQFVIY